MGEEFRDVRLRAWRLSSGAFGRQGSRLLGTSRASGVELRRLPSQVCGQGLKGSRKGAGVRFEGLGPAVWLFLVYWLGVLDSKFRFCGFFGSSYKVILQLGCQGFAYVSIAPGSADEFITSGFGLARSRAPSFESFN